METRSNNLLVGGVTLLLLLALAAFTMWLANAGGRDRVEYDIFFKQAVDGLNKGSGVLFSGVPAGQVVDIALWRPDPQFVRVRIEVDSDIPILQGTTAALEGVGFTGVSQIQLDGAVRGAAAITDEGPAGRPVIPTRIAGLGEILNSAPQLLERLSTLTERLTELANDRNQRSLSTILENVESSTGTLARSGPQLQAALADARVAARQAGDAMQEIGQLADSTDQMVTRDGAAMLAELRAAAASAQRSIATLEGAIEEARPGLNAFSNRTIPEANALLRDLRQTADTLSTVAESIEQRGAGGLLGQRLPDYEPADR